MYAVILFFVDKSVAVPKTLGENRGIFRLGNTAGINDLNVH